MLDDIHCYAHPAAGSADTLLHYFDAALVIFFSDAASVIFSSDAVSQMTALPATFRHNNSYFGYTHGIEG